MMIEGLNWMLPAEVDTIIYRRVEQDDHHY